MEQGASYGVILVGVDATTGASEEEYQILSKFNILFVRATVSGRRWLIQYALRIVVPSLLFLLVHRCYAGWIYTISCCYYYYYYYDFLLIHRSYAGWLYTIGCYYYYDFLFFFLFFCPRFLQILGQTHDKMENGKLATHICESFRPSSVIDHYPTTW
jgi:hypothetical protein